ncbi:MAG TPA: DNA polymerase/3'-5' exonuclease PolX [Tepidisphaeraceae bacterium]|jgi:DNA polymerase (family 10)|nr:DNA polymerase/3'-5' exonuclease PolX [Tepidisphaeraceae bacterium]
MSLNDQLSELFHNFAALMELKGENVFKVIAFQKVGRIIRELNIDLKKCIEEGKLCEIEGIGKSSQQIIEEFVETGKSSAYEDLAKSVPEGLVPMLGIEGIGPKTINLFWKQLDITSLDQLSKAIADGKLAKIKGMGEKKIAAILKGIENYKSRLNADGSVPRRTGIADAMEQAEPLVEAVRKIPGVARAEIAGSLRRRKETIGDVDLIAAVKNLSDAGKVIEEFVKLPGVVQTLGAGESKASVKVANGMQVDLRVVPRENFGAALMYFTGSKEHNVKIRGLAQKQKMTLNEWGLYEIAKYEKAKKETAKPPPIKAVASESEESIYQSLGIVYVEPEMREDFGEVELARDNKLPKLITLKDIRGDLHTHTNASDGRNTIEEMAAAAKAAGYEFLAITDHSKAMAMANGLTVDRLIKHIEQIHKVSDKLKGITLLAGAEVDILADGRMDYEDDVLKLLDIVVASPHVSLKQDTKKATDRLLRAIDNKYVNIIGHPTGRLINTREGLPLEMDKLFKAAAANGTALEINAGYPRLDLNDIHARAALAAECMLAIDTDSHTANFEEIKWGIGVARRAWATPKNVINCMKLPDLKKFLAAKRGR